MKQTISYDDHQRNRAFAFDFDFSHTRASRFMRYGLFTFGLIWVLLAVMARGPQTQMGGLLPHSNGCAYFIADCRGPTASCCKAAEAQLWQGTFEQNQR